jgi:hypothetical protein
MAVERKPTESIYHSFIIEMMNNIISLDTTTYEKIIDHIKSYYQEGEVCG